MKSPFSFPGVADENRTVVFALTALALCGLAVFAWLAFENGGPSARPDAAAATPVIAEPSGIAAAAEPSSVAVATAAGERDPGLVEICGLGWVETKPDSAGAEILRQIPGLEESLRSVMTGLRESPDEYSQAAGLLLEMKGGSESAADSALLDQLARLAVTSDDPRVYALAYRVCGRAPAAGSCALLSAAQWARVDAGNGEPWLFVLDAAAARGDRAQVEEALHRIGTAPRFDDRYQGVAGPIIARAGSSDSDLVAADILMTHAIGVAAALPLPLQRLTQACRETTLADANRRQLCDAVATALAERSDSIVLSSIGANIGKRVGWPLERVIAVRALSVALAETWAPDPGADPRPEPSYSCAVVRATLDRVDRLAQVGEPEVARDWIAAKHKPFEAYASAAREQEARRSAVEAEDAARRSATPTRAASAAD